ncbi:MAG: lipid A biosynthesis acyltransferase [Gammaproteobacteria bacterium]|nr:MAG: lipid A biosynthesis acyltransferase [Gammaproteobacteria bacterium]RLA52683.1 MAG: lipid A biosynthesis acyltransferase [Gammaproteobacteria bacterium]
MVESERHWSKVGEAGTILGMKLLLLIYRLLGRKGFKLLLLPVMSYYYFFKKEAREASKQYLDQLRPFLANEKSGSLSSFNHFLMFGEVLLDKILVWMGDIRREDVVFEMPTVLEKIDNSHKGGVIIVSHLGNTEVCSALAHQIPDIRLTLLMYTEHAQKFNAMIKKVSSGAQIEILQVTDISPATAMVLSERIEAGEYIVIAGDRTPVTGLERVSKVRFLGKKAPLPQGAFILGSLLKCPVYLMFCLKEQAQYHIYVELFSPLLKFHRKEREVEINSCVQRYADRLEYYCLKAPLQWFNFFPFWGDEP